MSTADLTEIRAAVRFRGDYQNVRKFPNADVDREIQKAFGEFYALVDQTHEGFWDTEATVVTVASVQNIALPSRAWRVHAVDRLDGSDYVPLDHVGRSRRNSYGSSTGTPVAYRLSSRGIEMYPKPDAAYTLRVFFTPVAPELCTCKAREWYNGWDDYVIESTLLKLDRREGKPLAERERGIEAIEKRIKGEATEHRSQEPEYLVLRENSTVGNWPFGEID